METKVLGANRCDTDPDGNVQGTNLEGHQAGADYGALVVMDGFNTAPTTPGMTWNDFPEAMHNQGKRLVEIPTVIRYLLTAYPDRYFYSSCGLTHAGTSPSKGLLVVHV